MGLLKEEFNLIIYFIQATHPPEEIGTLFAKELTNVYRKYATVVMVDFN